MRAEHDGFFLAQGGNELADIEHLVGVETAGRFIQDQHFGIVDLADLADLAVYLDLAELVDLVDLVEPRETNI